MNEVQTPRTGPDANPDEPRGAYRRFAVHAGVVIAALAALGALPTQRLAGSAGWMAMMAAVLVCLTASVAGTLPLWRARHLPPAHTVSAQLAAMALRLGVVAVLAVAIATAGLVPLPAFLLWLAIAHAGLLFADTAFARSIIRFTEVRSAANASTGSDPKEPQEP